MPVLDSDVIPCCNGRFSEVSRLLHRDAGKEYECEETTRIEAERDLPPSSSWVSTPMAGATQSLTFCVQLIWRRPRTLSVEDQRHTGLYAVYLPSFSPKRTTAAIERPL